MAMEIEAKVHIDDPSAVEQSCRKLEAVYGGAWRQSDRFFDHPDHRLLENDSALRMRNEAPLDEAARKVGQRAFLTYKGPRRTGRTKMRAEYEVEVADPEMMATILGQLDYTEAFSYEKRRRKWRLGDAEVTLDEVPHLGLFVEVEGPDEAQVEQTFDRLGLGDRQRITDSYLQMLTKKLGDQSGLGHITLDD